MTSPIGCNSVQLLLGLHPAVCGLKEILAYFMPDSSCHKYWITELLLNCVKNIFRNGAGMWSFKKTKCIQVNL